MSINYCRYLEVEMAWLDLLLEILLACWFILINGNQLLNSKKFRLLEDITAFVSTINSRVLLLNWLIFTLLRSGDYLHIDTRLLS